jgi:hypothetical protein
MAVDRYASLKQGLVGAWIPSVSGSGLLLPDLSGRGNNGTLTNMDASDWVSAQYGRALDFDGVNDTVEVPFRFNSTGVIAFWYRGTTEPGTAIYLGDKSNTGTEVYLGQNITNSLTNELITFSNDVGGTARLYGYTSATRTELFNNAWHHVAIVLRQVNTAPEIYLDGSSKTVTLGTSSLTAWSIGSAGGTTLQFGSQNFSNTNSFFLTGQLDDIRIYNRALTEPEIKLLASEPGIGLVPQRKNLLFQQQQFSPAWSRRQQLIGSGVY